MLGLTQEDQLVMVKIQDQVNLDSNLSVCYS